MKTILTTILLGVLISIPTLSGCSKNSRSVIQESQTLLSSGKYEEAIDMLEQAYRADGTADSLKPVLTNAHLLYGNYLMYKSDLPQSQKYGKALTEFRRVLTLDFGNQEAKKNKEIIEGIYIQEGIPLPKE